MSAPPLKRPVATCQAKRRYPDELTARAVAQTYLEHPLTYEAGVHKLWVYRCPECHGWHTTKRPHGRRWLVTRDELVHFPN
jgi:hypothetical protein